MKNIFFIQAVNCARKESVKFIAVKFCEINRNAQSSSFDYGLLQRIHSCILQKNFFHMILF